MLRKALEVLKRWLLAINDFALERSHHSQDEELRAKMLKRKASVRENRTTEKGKLDILKEHNLVGRVNESSKTSKSFKKRGEYVPTEAKEIELEFKKKNGQHVKIKGKKVEKVGKKEGKSCIKKTKK